MSSDPRAELPTDAYQRGRGTWPSHPGTSSGAEEPGNELPVSTRRAAPTKRPRQRQMPALSRFSAPEGPFGTTRQTGVPPPRERSEWGGGGGGGASALAQRLSALIERSSALTLSAGKNTGTGNRRCPFHWPQPATVARPSENLRRGLGLHKVQRSRLSFGAQKEPNDERDR